MNVNEIDYRKLPAHMQDGMRLYIENGIEPGSFMYAVLCNDLMGAFGRADSVNKARIGDFCQFLYNDAPSQCHGSPAKVKAWIESRNQQAAYQLEQYAAMMVQGCCANPSIGPDYEVVSTCFTLAEHIMKCSIERGKESTEAGRT